MASRKIFGLFLGCELLSVSRRLRLQIYELFNKLTSKSGTYNKQRIKMAKMMEKPDSKLQRVPKTAARPAKISNTARKHSKDENSGKLRQRSSNVRASTFWATIG